MKKSKLALASDNHELDAVQAAIANGVGEKKTLINLCRNSDFADGKTNWNTLASTKEDSVTIETDPVFGNVAVLTSLISARAGIYQSVDVNINDTIFVGMWVKKILQDVTYPRIVVRDEAKNIIDRIIGDDEWNLLTLGEWTYMSKIITSSSGIVTLEIGRATQVKYTMSVANITIINLTQDLGSYADGLRASDMDLIMDNYNNKHFRESGILTSTELATTVLNKVNIYSESQSSVIPFMIESTIASQLGSVARLLFFKPVSGTTVIDKAYKGNATLSADASTLTPSRLGFLNTLMLKTGDTWQCANAADLSFGDGAGNDSAFSVVWFGKLDDVASGIMIAKRIVTPGAVQSEYQMFLSGDQAEKKIAFSVYKSDGTAYIGRKSPASTAYTSGYNTFIATYSGSKAASGIKIYQNGVQIDDSDYNSGTYGGMSAGDAVVGNFKDNDGTLENPMSGTVGLVAIVRSELTALQVSELDAVIRSAYGLI